MIIPIAAAAAIVAVPFLLWLFYSWSEKEIYNGDAIVLTKTGFVGKTGRTGFVDISVPGIGTLTADITPERAVAVGGGEVMPVKVTVRKRLFGQAWIETVLWSDDGKLESSEDQRLDSLAISGFFLIAGLFLLPTSAILAGVGFILSGFILGNTARKLNLDGQKGLMVSLAIMAVLLGIATVAVFQQVTVLTLFLGVPFAFSLGQIGGMLARSSWNAKS
jgi:hypothetical protein